MDCREARGSNQNINTSGHWLLYNWKVWESFTCITSAIRLCKMLLKSSCSVNTEGPRNCEVSKTPVHISHAQTLYEKVLLFSAVAFMLHEFFFSCFLFYTAGNFIYWVYVELHSSPSHPLKRCCITVPILLFLLLFHL